MLSAVGASPALRQLAFPVQLLLGVSKPAVGAAVSRGGAGTPALLVRTLSC